jgi:suppressor of ftsI
MIFFRPIRFCVVVSLLRRSNSAVISLSIAGILCACVPCYAQVRGSGLLSDPPEARSPITLSAVSDPKTGKSSFSFNGVEDPPVIRVSPGGTLSVTYDNKMSAKSSEQCIYGLCMNMTNLHFHGLHVSPDSPQDDVITMLAMPGQTLHYAVEVPADQPPGLYWYHTHPHGESYQQSLDGMSGAIVIEGIERYAPEVRGMKERILILRDEVLHKEDVAGTSALVKRLAVPSGRCGSAVEQQIERVFTVNGTIRPQIPIAPGERQFWRIVNASPDLYADLQVDSERLVIIAMDGMPLSFHDPKRHSELADHILLPPAGRVEAIVTGPKAGASASLRTRCFDTGADGDPNPEMAIADLVDQPHSAPRPAHVSATTQPPVYKPFSKKTSKEIERKAPQFVVVFTEDDHGFYINGKKYGPADDPMTTVDIGSYEHWRVVNNTKEVHPFHIHQVHFLAYAENNVNVGTPPWLDTVNIAPGGSMDLIMDFTDPVIRGMSVFHCHLLKHEDKGMMAKILFR